LPHPFQTIILLTKIREIAVVTGQGWGKSQFAPIWLVDGMVQSAGDVMFTEPTYDMVERIAIPNFLDFIHNTEAEGEWISKKHHIYGTDFGRVFFLSTDYPEHLQGSHIKRAIMDEAGMSPFIAYQMVKNRTNLYNGQVLALSNPYRNKDAWLFTNIKARYDSGDPEVMFLTSPSIWNPAFDRQRFEKDRKIMRPEEFAFYYLGIYTKPEGLIFPYEREDVVKDLKYEGQTCYGGADFGTGDPTVLEIAFLNSTGLHLIDEYYKQDVDISTHAIAFISLIKKYKIKEIFYDPTALVYVRQMKRELEKEKINVKWTKGKSGKREGIEAQTKLFRQKRLTISPRCYRMLDEDMNYIWGLNGEAPDKDDHCETARKYLTLGVNEILKRKEPTMMKTEIKQTNWIQEHFENLWNSVMAGTKRKEIKNWLERY